MSSAREDHCVKIPDDAVWVTFKIKLNKTLGNYLKKKKIKKKEKSGTRKEAAFSEERDKLYFI